MALTGLARRSLLSPAIEWAIELPCLWEDFLWRIVRVKAFGLIEFASPVFLNICSCDKNGGVGAPCPLGDHSVSFSL